MDRGLRYLVVKPTLFCTAACPICALRRDLFSRKLGHQPLSSDEWVGVIRDAHALGCSDLRVSGGEPTLYPGLAALVGAASDLGMHTGVNTNGSALSPELLESLLVAGLDSVTVSIYSHDPSKHDLMRREPGLFRRAVHALRRAADMSGLEVNINTVLTRANLLEFDKILELALQLGADSLHVSYLEGDMEKKWLPRVGMIRTFRAEVIPRAEAVLREHLPGALASAAVSQLRGFFSSEEDVLRLEQGLYRPDGSKACSIPCEFALVLADGDVLPCNGTEYCHEPVMGNVRKEELAGLWRSKAWERHRVNGTSWCRRCPMPLHRDIAIARASVAS